MAEIRVVLADDHEVVLSGLTAMIGAAGDMKVVALARNADDALEQVAQFRPDVLVADVSMPDQSGLELARRVFVGWPSTRVVMLSMHESEAYVSQALRQGAIGYVLKSSPSKELLEAIRCAVRGERYLANAISVDALERYEARFAAQAPNPARFMTERELDVLRLVVRGLTSAEIADELDIGKRTVESHRANLLRKLGARSTADMVRFAIENGIADDR
jgi:DNA-binding NarL/FixJ family response regulator